MVMRTITRAEGRIVCGLRHRFRLGNLDSTRDWGFAGDYVESMWKMLPRDRDEGVVIATGTHDGSGDVLSAALGWQPATSFAERVSMMVRRDHGRARNEPALVSMRRSSGAAQ